MAFSYAVRTWGLYVVLLLLALIFLTGLGSSVLSIILNVLLLIGFFILTFNEASYNGEKACTVDAMIEKQISEGRKVDESQKKRGFSRATGVKMFAICLAPFLIVSVLNLVMAPNYPEVVTEPVEHEAFYQPEEGEEPDLSPVNPFNVAARMVYMPYVFSYNLVPNKTLNWLMLLYAFIVPGCAFAGYMAGPAMRRKKLRDIALGKKRKLRNIKVNKGPKKPKAEV